VPNERGRLTALSPASGRVWWSIEGETKRSRIHRAAHVLEDVNGDGVLDIACIGSGPATVTLLSGADATEWSSIQLTDTADPNRECNISSVRSCADADGDARSDVLIGYGSSVRSVPGGDGRAGIAVASSRTGRILLQVQDGSAGVHSGAK